jgi:SagB-type dehydrogenase family enzyme
VTTPIEEVISYHLATKHHFHRFARGPGSLDWANQPDPFRTYQGAARIPLPFAQEETPSFGSVLKGELIPAREVTLASIGQLFELSMGLSAWKEYQGSRWALRVNPSSGNLHPTEAYLVCGALQGKEDESSLQPMVCHYAPFEHSLEVRTTFSSQVWEGLTAGFPPGTLLVGLSSIHWREAWKYGERAFRYCQHDAGHALAALSYSCALLGWRLMVLDGMPDDPIASLLGLDREEGAHPLEREHLDLLAAIITQGETPSSLPEGLPDSWVEAIGKGVWSGKPNRLSEEHIDWDIIADVARASWKPPTASMWKRDLLQLEKSKPDMSEPPIALLPLSSEPARALILRRRSAVAYDGQTGISSETFYSILAQTLPYRGDLVSIPPPWNAIPWQPSVHLGLFVHRVEGLPPGLYILVRQEGKETDLRNRMDPSFLWEKPSGCPERLDLFLLKIGDARSLAAQVSCGQDIAGGGAFSLGMVAKFEEKLRGHGAWFYRNLFWETGMIGQVLYLAAEAAGIRATGIGCFFDDAVHQVFGLSGLEFQSLYHFTLGGPVEDKRLMTLPPYSRERMAQV